MLRKLSVALTVVSVVVLGITSVAAQEEDAGVVSVESDDYGSVTVFTDGRVNDADLAAPVLVYYISEKVPVLDTQNNYVWGEGGGIYYEDVVTGIELLEVESTGYLDLVLQASVADVQAAQADGDSQLVGDKGYTLNFGDNGWLWVSAPADAEGKVYTFSWDDLGRLLNND